MLNYENSIANVIMISQPQSYSWTGKGLPGSQAPRGLHFFFFFCVMVSFWGGEDIFS